MRRIIKLMALLFVVAFVGGQALADDFFVYPSKGQTKDQMERDKFECYTWAKQQTGFDPMEIPKATAPPPPEEPRQGGMFRGAVKGAALGAVVGEIADDDPGKGAAIGAASGALFGGMRRRDQAIRQEKAREDWARQQTAQYSRKRDTYNRAYAACLEGKGYTVK